MTIVTTIIGKTTDGNKRIVYGKSVLSGTTNTGTVLTGLRDVEFFKAVEYGGAQKVNAIESTTTASLPSRAADGGIAVITESNDASFYWLAIGK